MENKVENSNKFFIPDQITLTQQSYKVTFVICITILLLLNFPMILHSDMNTGGVIYVLVLAIACVTAVTDLLALLLLLGCCIGVCDGTLAGNKWHFDFVSCVILHKDSKKRTSLIQFSEIREIKMLADDFVFNTQQIHLMTKSGLVKTINPVTVPPGLVPRLKEACKCKPQDSILSKRCLLPANVSLEAVLLALADSRKQTATFWKPSAWLPKEKQASAYYRMEEQVLWTVHYIQEEWVLIKMGHFPSPSWELLRSCLE